MPSIIQFVNYFIITLKMALLRQINKTIRFFPLINPHCEYIHHTAALQAFVNNKNKEGKWLKYNEVIYPPQSPDEPRRPAVQIHEFLRI